MKIFATKRTSNKSGKAYYALIMERNGMEIFLSFDKMTILRATNKTLNEIEQMQVGECIEIK